MNLWLLAASLSVASLLLLPGCATEDDDPFPTRPAAADADAVPGAATPPPESSNAGWKW